MTRKKFLTLGTIICLMVHVFTPVHGEAEQRHYAGTEACIQCHDDIYTSFQNDPHGIAADRRTPAATYGCETCHGPGSAHSANEGKGGIILLNGDSSTDNDTINVTCLACHTKNNLIYWQGSSHEQRDLSCTTCHSIHQDNPRSLKNPNETDLCTPCHKQIRPELLRQSHHPIREGKMACSDCHNPHGTVEDDLIDSRTVNLKCYECHAEKRGPYLWEHPPAVENCVTCHTPHGSSHSPLLNGKAPYLCQRCHSNPTHNSDLYARQPDQRGESVYRSMNSRAFYRACLNCHLSVHGSNHPSGRLLLR